MFEPDIIARDASDKSPVTKFYYGLDVREALRLLPDKSVHMIATSPPYWGLRNYGTDPVTWDDNDPDCDHEWDAPVGYVGHRGNRGQVPQTKWPSNQTYPQHTGAAETATCKKCGAWLGHLGQEATPEAYVRHLVEVFREAGRVLRDDGILWLNLGDSFASNGCYINAWMQKDHNKDKHHLHSENYTRYGDRKAVRGGEYAIKAKDLVGIPWRAAFALQADGWYLRRDIIWEKGNPMPESVEDRCTSSHEYIFMLTKQPTYFYDYIAIKEPTEVNREDELGKAVRTRNSGGRTDGYTVAAGTVGDGTTRNKRSVWHVNTCPYPGAHFATWPEDLVEVMIKAGTSEKGCCPACGAPWRRIVQIEREARDNHLQAFGSAVKAGAERVYTPVVSSTTTGWEPTCECPAHEPVRCVVLDTFSGSGTTASVAMRLGRDAIGLDLKIEYLALAERRVRGLPESKQKKGAEVLECANPFDLLADFEEDTQIAEEDADA